MCLLVADVEWELVWEKSAPPWLPREAPAEDEGLNWEMTSLLAALPVYVEAPNVSDEAAAPQHRTGH